MGEELGILTQAGAVGIALALIGLIYWIVRWTIRMTTNHLQHNTEALQELKDAIHQLIDYLKNNHK